MKVLCIIPVYNEDNKLNNLINQIKINPYKDYNLEYVFVNNGSTDKSLSIIKDNNFKFLNLKKNKGVGYALILGFLFAKKYKYDYIVHLAGNGKMNPKYISRFISLIHQDNYDFISGSRFLEGASFKNNPLYRVFLIKIFSLILRIMTKKKITDATCGYRAFRVDLFKNFKKNFLKEKLFTYGYEYFSYGKVLNRNNLKIKEIAVSMDYPSKKNYTKIRPIIDWIVMAKFWIIGYYNNDEL
tara:strand:+ start:10 stop:732 length:723 start_codon:yes stop_codon:yes gene_type:complete